MAIEALYPLALVSRRARLILVPGAIGLQVGIELLMGISFRAFMLANIFWIPWERVAELLRRPRARGAGLDS